MSNFHPDGGTRRHKLLNKKCSILHDDLNKKVKLFRTVPIWELFALKVWKKV